MALDRQTIEKRDFPIGRRGYEPEAVDEHLQRLADQIEDLQRSAQRRSGASLAQAASEQVRAIVEAAEQSAAAIERDAESEAQRIRQDAERDAERTDNEAVERSREHVAKVSEQSSVMLQRVDAMEQELTALVDSLRTGANRLKADLSLLETNMEDLYEASGGRPGTAAADRPDVVSPPAAVAAPAPAPVPAEEAFEEDELLDETEPITAVEPPPAAAAPPEAAPQPARTRPAPAPSGPATAGDGGDVEGARLIALNMALNGQSRDETDRYLAENFDLADRQGLLDEVYESVGG